jgi:hypothetical protein
MNPVHSILVMQNLFHGYLPAYAWEIGGDVVGCTSVQYEEVSLYYNVQDFISIIILSLKGSIVMPLNGLLKIENITNSQ